MSSTPAKAGRVFRPRLWPTIATLAGIAVLLSLGTWQLQRLEWKRGLIEHAERQLAAPATPLPATGLEDFDFRRVSLTGTYLHNAAFAFGFTAEGGAPGSRLITPFRLEDGRVLLIDRGWLPKWRVPNCAAEYAQARLAFEKTIAPHLDSEITKQVQATTWLATANTPPANPQLTTSAKTTQGPVGRDTSPPK